MKTKKQGKPSKKAASSKPGSKASQSGLRPRVLISGYYGFDNLGDELILKVLVDELKARKVDITVLSQNPKKTAEQYGVDAIKRTSFIDIVDALSKTNLFISGGGGLFQDVTGPMSSIYYGGLIHLAKFFEVPSCFWAQGVGPLNKGFSRKFTASAIRKCEKVIVRDEKSAALVGYLTGEKPEITADPVWLLKTASRKPDKKTERSEKAASGLWRIGVSLRPWPELTGEKLLALATCLNALAEQAEKPVEFLLLPFQKAEDTELLEGFSKLLKTDGQATVRMADASDVLTAIGDCDVILGMRFHSLILGILHNVPVYGLVYDPKVASLLAMFDLKGSPIAGLQAISPDEVSAYFKAYPTIDLKPIREQSRRNIRILEKLLKIPEAELVL